MVWMDLYVLVRDATPGSLTPFFLGACVFKCLLLKLCLTPLPLSVPHRLGAVT